MIIVLTKKQVDRIFDPYTFKETCKNIIQTSLKIYDRSMLAPRRTLQDLERNMFISSIEDILIANQNKKILFQDTLIKEYACYTEIEQDYHYRDQPTITANRYAVKMMPYTDLVLQDYDVIHAFVYQKILTFETLDENSRIIVYKGSFKNSFHKPDWKQMELF